MRIDQLIQPLGDAQSPGGTVIVIRHGRVIYRRAVGLADVEAGRPNTARTNFRLASVTKQFTAMAVMMLVEEGRLSYETRLTELFPDFPAYAQAITVRHLLTHTSGLIDYEDLIPASTTAQLKDRDVLRLMREQAGTYFPPGAEYRYSNSGYAVLAMVVEQISGQAFAAFLRERIFHPLGMNHTVAYEAGVSQVVERAFGYSPLAHGFQRTDQSLTSAVLGDGGIYTSVDDLCLWDRALYGDQLVRPETFQQAFTPARLNDGRAIEYGFGWRLGTYRGLPYVRHGGSTIGFRTGIERYPQQQFTVILLSNRNDTQAEEIIRAIVDVCLFAE